jgi:hypothetical protein
MIKTRDEIGGHIANMGTTENIHKIINENPKGRDHLGDLDADVRS